MDRISPKHKDIWDLIDFLLDCLEYPQPGEFRQLPTIDGKDLRVYAMEEYRKIKKR
jgi:hypothetical protein